MKKLIRYRSLFLLYFVISTFFSCSKNVDLIVHNAKIYTVNENFEVASSFAVKNGKFLDVGGKEIIQKYNSKETLNMQGKVILPGLIDAHCHFYGLGINQQVIDLVGTNSFDEILKKLVENSKGKSIVKGT